MKKLTLLLMMACFSLTFMQAQEGNLPIDFEAASYDIVNFDGGDLTVIANPHSSGINTSANVGQMIKGAGQTWAGAYIFLATPIDFTIDNLLSMKVYSPRTEADVLLKLENADDNQVFMEVTATTTVADEWEILTFDFTGGVTDTYSKVVIIMDNGTAGDGSADWTFLIDDIEQGDGINSISLFEIDNSFEVYPNIANNQITISSEKVMREVNIYNSIGQLIISEEINSDSKQIQISSLTNGVYLIRVENTDGTFGISNFIKE